MDQGVPVEPAGVLLHVEQEGWRKEREAHRWRLLHVAAVEAEKWEKLQLEDQIEPAGAAAVLTEWERSLGFGAKGWKVRERRQKEKEDHCQECLSCFREA